MRGFSMRGLGEMMFPKQLEIYRFLVKYHRIAQKILRVVTLF